MFTQEERDEGDFMWVQRQRWVDEQLHGATKECVLVSQERVLVRSMRPVSQSALNDVLRYSHATLLDKEEIYKSFINYRPKIYRFICWKDCICSTQENTVKGERLESVTLVKILPSLQDLRLYTTSA